MQNTRALRDDLRYSSTSKSVNNLDAASLLFVGSNSASLPEPSSQSLYSSASQGCPAAAAAAATGEAPEYHLPKDGEDEPFLKKNDYDLAERLNGFALVPLVCLFLG